jgi:tetratricopeptide (TPR) repeat protein
MSDSIMSSGWRSRFAGRWQIPLLLASCAAFGWGLYRVRPEPPVVTFAEQLDQVRALQEAGLYLEASQAAEAMLSAPERSAAEQRQLHRLLADVIFESERGASVRTPVNIERLIRHYRLSVESLDRLDAEGHRRLGQAWEWLGRPWEAIRAYRQALARHVPDSVALRRRILELQLVHGAPADEAVAKELDGFLDLVRDDPGAVEHLLWAAQRRLEIFFGADQPDAAEAFLAGLAPSIERAATDRERNQYEFLVAQALFYQGRYEDAERTLRAIRQRMVVRDAVDAGAAWLLGRIYQIQAAPEVALGLFDEVLARHFEGAYVGAARLGRAECLAQLERHAEAVAAYEAAVAMLREVPVTRIFGPELIRASATGWYEAMRQAGRYEPALPYLRVAIGLVAPGDENTEAVYAERLADLLSILGGRDLAAADAASGEEGVDAEARGEALRSRAGKRLLEAGDAYLRLAELRTDQESESADAVWKAADRFDQAGARVRSIEVFEAFIENRPHSARVPAALFRLGQGYQALDQYAEAVRSYQRVLTDFARTPSAVSSFVPLAECFMALGDAHYEDAETTLLSLLEEPPDRPPLLTPAANEFRNGLFKLCDLYLRWRRYEQAIVRLEEAIRRYGEDPRITVMRYHLAEAYRLSAAEIPAKLAEAENLARREPLIAELLDHLDRARELYEGVIAAFGDGAGVGVDSPAGGSELAGWYVKMSHFYRADCVFDAQEFRRDPDGYALAIRLYEEAAWKYRGEPIALSAYVQMIHAYLRMGELERARATLARARWILRGIPADPATWSTVGEPRESWEEYLAWLSDAPMFASP